MEPPVLFRHWRLRRCEVELEEQRLGLLDQLRYCRPRGHRLYLLRPCSRPYARLAKRSRPGILGASDDFLDGRSTDANQKRDCRALRATIPNLGTRNSCAS